MPERRIFKNISSFALMVVLLAGCVDTLQDTRAMIKGPIERELAAIETQRRLEREDFREWERAQIYNAQVKAIEAIEKYERGEGPLPVILGSRNVKDS